MPQASCFVCGKRFLAPTKLEAQSKAIAHGFDDHYSKRRAGTKEGGE